MDRKNSLYYLVSKTQWLITICYVLLLFIYLAVRQFGTFNPDHRLLTLIIFVVSYPVYSVFNVFTLRTGVATNILRISSAWLVLLSMLALMGFVTKTSARFSREAFLLWSTIGLFLQVILLPLQLRLSRFMLGKLSVKNRVLVVGDKKLVESVVEKIKQLDTEIVAAVLIIDEAELEKETEFPILTDIHRLIQYLEDYQINKIYLAMDRENQIIIKDLYIELLDRNIDIVWVPDLSDILLINHSVDDLMGLPIIRLSESPLTTNQFLYFIKNVLDKIIALASLIVLSPVLIGVGFIIKITSPGPVIYRQQRHGLNGKVFCLYKFRSMRLENNHTFKQATANDNRVTPIGRLIRKTSIDELPQLINVLKGDMSLVGPRPHATEMNDYYSNKIQSYMARHKIKPGMTGLAQIRGSRGETDTMEKMETRFEYDLEYINNWSIFLDLKILLATPWALVKINAY